jgi:hypothetical protein
MSCQDPDLVDFDPMHGPQYGSGHSGGVPPEEPEARVREEWLKAHFAEPLKCHNDCGLPGNGAVDRGEQWCIWIVGEAASP